MLINISLALILAISKIINQTQIFNILYLPFLFYIFFSNKSVFFLRNISLKLFLGNLLIILFSYLLFRNIEFDPLVLILKSISLASFYLALFGLLPINFEVFKSLRLSIFISFFAIFFIYDPPTIFRYAADKDIFVGSVGLFASFSLSGLFPTSFYFAQLITAYIIYLNSFFIKDNSQKIISFLPNLVNKILLTIFLIFTNRKAFLFALIIYPIYNFLLVFMKTIRTKLIEKKVFLAVCISAFIGLIGYLTLYFGTQNVDYDIFYIINETFSRITFYSNWAINPDQFVFAETGIMSINKIGGYFLYSLTIIFLSISLLISLSKIKYHSIINFILAYSFIFLFLFKEAATIFSPSPSSLLLYMMVSYLIKTI